MTLDDRVRDACHRIEELYYETGGKCYISFSGGKDSTVILALIKLCEEIFTIPEGGIPAVYVNTGIELGVTNDFVRKVRDEGWYSNVQIIRPDVSFDYVIKKYGKPAKSKLKAEYFERWQHGNKSRSVMQNLVYCKTNSGRRATRTCLADKDIHFLHNDFSIPISNKCCQELKKKPMKKYAHQFGLMGSMTGMRMSEGGARDLNIRARAKTDARICTAIDKKGFIKKTPIVDWTDEDLENFIKEYNVPLSDAYTKYRFRRTGCMCCPFSMKIDKDLEYLYFYEPNRYKASMHWLKDVYIAQNVILPFDEAYERERERMWSAVYEPMRQEMLRKYRPNSPLIKETSQISMFEFM